MFFRQYDTTANRLLYRADFLLFQLNEKVRDDYSDGPIKKFGRKPYKCDDKVHDSCHLEAQGMNFLLNKNSDEILVKKRLTGLKFKDETSVDAELIVMAVGIRPNVELAKNSGIEVERGIVVNDYMETSVQNVYAVGECAQHREMVYGLVAPLYEQGAVLAKHLAGVETEPYE